MRTRRFRLLAGALVLAASLYLWFPSGSLPAQGSGSDAIDDLALRNADARRADWITHGRTYSEARFSPLSQINAENVKDLGLVWAYDAETTRGLEATPIVVNGVLYTTSSWSVVLALDAKSGKLIWKWDPLVNREYGQRACCDVVNRGVAFYKGRIYVGVLDGRLVSLDARTGKVVWSTVTVDQSSPYTITGAPRVVKGKVIIGNGGAEFGVRGYVSAYDAESGKLVWRFHTVPGDPTKPFENEALAHAAKTWTGEWWKMGGGGTVWDSIAFDPELDLLYVGTGNGSPWNQTIRSPGGGDNLYLASILALRPDSGELVWYYQTTPGETWDFTATQHMILADLSIGGRIRKVLMQAPKNGFFYVLDRENGNLISADAFVEVTWASGIDPKSGRPIEAPGARYRDSLVIMKPGPIGAHNWQPMSYSPRTGLVYIPAQDTFFAYGQDRTFRFRPGAWNTGIDVNLIREPLPELPPGHLLAWDPIARRERWRAQYSSIWNGGTLSTAGNLVFQGTADGRFVAYRSDTGEKLWEVATGTGIIASPVTYEVEGVQYVSVMAGWGGAFGLLNGLTTGRAIVPGKLLTFAKGGEKVLPRPDHRFPELTPIESKSSPEQIDRGAQAYAMWCAVCHGVGAVGGGSIADLRYSAPSTFEAYPAIVLDGSFARLGMPTFKQWLTREEVDAIREFVLSRRAGLLKR